MQDADYAIYLRIREDEPCPTHWDYASASQNGLRLDGDPCPICWGTGKKVYPFITPIRMALGSTEGQNIFKSMPGYVEKWQIGAYVPRNVIPEYNDLLWIVEWNIPVNEVPTNPARRVVRIDDVLIIKAIVNRFEKEVAIIGVDLRPLNIEKTVLKVNLPLTVNLDVIKPEEWKRTTYW